MAWITPTSLYELIKESTESMKVLTPSTDYYARRGDSDETTISFVNPDKFLTLLEEKYVDEL